MLLFAGDLLFVEISKEWNRENICEEHFASPTSLQIIQFQLSERVAWVACSMDCLA